MLVLFFAPTLFNNLFNEKTNKSNAPSITIKLNVEGSAVGAFGSMDQVEWNF